MTRTTTNEITKTVMAPEERQTLDRGRSQSGYKPLKIVSSILRISERFNKWETNNFVGEVNTKTVGDKS